MDIYENLNTKNILYSTLALPGVVLQVEAVEVEADSYLPEESEWDETGGGGVSIMIPKDPPQWVEDY